MRARGTVPVTAAALLGAVLLGGCGPSGPAAPDAPSGGPGSPTGATGSATAAASSSPATGAPPGATPDPAASASPAPVPGRTVPAGETLVRATRSGGFAGQTHTLIVKGDGSWTRLDGRANPEGSGRLAPDRLAALSAALREADFARLPRFSKNATTVYDGFVHAVVHGGHEVAAVQGAEPPALARVLDALPPFTAEEARQSVPPGPRLPPARAERSRPPAGPAGTSPPGTFLLRPGFSAQMPCPNPA
ncbi:hypothetical protein ACFWTC_15465 [Streptomyces sp. NPDC058619]|uniref:hypothetical protein n=1 Tax=unclassified Streptomyces TaxID=2593676 RepID=UPI0036531D69